MQKDLTKGSALKNIITFSLPFLLANFLQTFYGMADLFIVGQYNGAASLSGVSIGSQVMHMITVMLVGIAMGSTVMIGRYVGERKEEEKRMTVGNTSKICDLFCKSFSKAARSCPGTSTMTAFLRHFA